MSKSLEHRDCVADEVYDLVERAKQLGQDLTAWLEAHRAGHDCPYCEELRASLDRMGPPSLRDAMVALDMAIWALSAVSTDAPLDGHARRARERFLATPEGAEQAAIIEASEQKMAEILAGDRVG